MSPGEEPSESLKFLDLGTIVAQTGNEITVRIWKVFETAKEEFHTITDSTSVEKQQAAKFLRDTAENTLQHLAKEEITEPQLNAELERALAVAKHTAEILSGGRKRKFDQPIMRSQRVVKGPVSERPQSQVREARDGYYYGEQRTVLTERRENDLFNGQARARSYSSTYERYPHDQSRRQLMSPELSPHRESRRRRDGRDRKRAKNHTARGHSGIPFGYTRGVDSYQPSPR